MWLKRSQKERLLYLGAVVSPKIGGFVKLGKLAIAYKALNYSNLNKAGISSLKGANKSLDALKFGGELSHKGFDK